jgi:type IV secretory pathway VirB10-like protein
LDAEVKANETTEHEIKETLTDTGLSIDGSFYICIDTPKAIKMASCPTCKRHLTEDVPANCANCVTNLLYNSRFELARVLLGKETLQKKVEAIVGPELETPLDEETAILRKAWQRQQENIEEQHLKEEEEDLQRELVLRKKEAEEKRAHAQALKENLEQRRANLLIAKDALARHSKKQQQELKDIGEKLKAQYDALHNRTVDTRAILCREAASLMKLSHLKKKAKDGTIQDRHYIAGLLLPDLKEINSKAGHKFLLIFPLIYEQTSDASNSPQLSET